MIFTSSVFVAFCLCFFPLYLISARWVRPRNLLILAASYLFYGWWDWRFLLLLIFTTSVDYLVARGIENAADPRMRKRLLLVSLASNLGVLGIFKYFNFFCQSFFLLLRHLGILMPDPTLRLLLPVGISFYTFQSLSYVIDVYRARTRAERDAVVFFAYVAFFPQLAAGPIERAEHMLPQFRAVRLPAPTSIRNGVWLLICGFFTKMVVADTLAPWVNLNFQANQTLGWSTILATLAFGLQIYGDFKGYSLIAKGLASLMGFDLMWNFNFPYWSCSVQEFWRRWHISLSTWLRDYLYIPLGGNRTSPPRVFFNIMITMLLGGLWHGAGWNFVIWGGWHGLALCINHWYRERFGGLASRTLGWSLTMLVVMVGWFFFRATDAAIFTGMLRSLHHLSWLGVHTAMLRIIVLLALPLFALEYVEYRNGQDQLTETGFRRLTFAAIASCMLLTIFAASQRPAVNFIYFQF